MKERVNEGEGRPTEGKKERREEEVEGEEEERGTI